MMLSTSTLGLVILTTQKDQRSQKDNIDIYTDQFSIRSYINPSKPDPGLPKEPKRPIVTDIKAITLDTIADRDADSNYPHRTTLYSDLSPSEQDYLRLLILQYNEDKRYWRKQVEGIAKLRVKIQETIAVDNYVYTRGPTAYIAIVKLQNRFKPTNEARELELTNTQNTLVRTNKVSDIDIQLQAWETMYNECLELKLLVVAGIWLVKGFLRAIKKVSPSFSNIITVRQSEGGVYEFRALL